MDNLISTRGTLLENYNEHNEKGDNFKHFRRIFPLKFAFVLKISAPKVINKYFVVLPPHLRCRNPVLCCVSTSRLKRRNSIVSPLCAVSHPVVLTLDREHNQLALAVGQSQNNSKYGG